MQMCAEASVLRAPARLMDKLSRWECEGATWLDNDGYHCYHEHAMDNLFLHSENFHVAEDCAVAGAEILRETAASAASLNAQNHPLR